MLKTVKTGWKLLKTVKIVKIWLKTVKKNGLKLFKKLVKTVKKSFSAVKTAFFLVLKHTKNHKNC